MTGARTNVRTDDEANKFTDDSKGNVAVNTVAEIDTSSGPVSVILNGSNVSFQNALETISAVKLITADISGVRNATSDSSLGEATVIGISLTSGNATETIQALSAGELFDSSFAFALNAPLFLTTSGSISETAPISGFITRIGHSLGPNKIYIQIDEPIEII